MSDYLAALPKEPTARNASPLPANFAFSQASLQDYADCPRRFQLRYVLKVRWPAAHDGPITEWEAKTQAGSAFHRLIHQHTVGIPAEILATAIETEDLRRWWQAYLDTPPPNLPLTGTPGAVRQTEVRLITPLAGHRLMARYDLLVVEPGKRAVIVDWKTNERRPRRAKLEDHWQTRVYRYVLVQAGTQFNADTFHPPGQPWRPEQIELIYWFANYPAQPERFPYDDAQFTEDEWALKAAIAEIASIGLRSTAGDTESGTQGREWTLTDDLTRCRYCTYRTLCDREKVDADGPELEPDDEGPFDLDIDLEQIAEIEF